MTTYTASIFTCWQRDAGIVVAKNVYLERVQLLAMKCGVAVTFQIFSSVDTEVLALSLINKCSPVDSEVLASSSQKHAD